MKNIFLAALGAVAAMVATPAVAANLEPVQIIPFVYTPNVGGNFGNDNPTPFNPGGVNFNNAFDFLTTYERTALVDITSMMTPGDPSTNINFISNGVTLTGTLIPAISTGQFEERYLANFRIPAGAQRILVQGSAGADGTYAGILALSGVPEPSTWALMILGLGFAGAAMRRRRQTARIAYA